MKRKSSAVFEPLGSADAPNAPDLPSDAGFLLLQAFRRFDYIRFLLQNNRNLLISQTLIETFIDFIAIKL